MIFPSSLEPSQVSDRILLLGTLFMLAGSVFVMSMTALALRLRRRQLQQRDEAAVLAELRRREEAAHERRLMRSIRREALWLARQIPVHLAQQLEMDHYAYNYDMRGRRRGRRQRKMIRFAAAIVTRTEIWFVFDGRKLPYGTSFNDILSKDKKPIVENALQYAIHRPCRLHTDSNYNVYLRVGLENSLMGIPRLVLWRDVVEALPASNPYAVAIGVNEYGKLVHQDVTRWPHGLVMGGTEAGKSKQLKQWIITLAQRNQPTALKMMLIDLKRVELHEFRKLPHVSDYADNPEEVIPLMSRVQREMTRRLDLFVGVCSDINGWNVQNPHMRLPRLILIIDELANVTTDRELKGKATQAILNVSRLGRAAGIHLILCTQTVSKAVLPMDVLANIEGRLCFAVANSSASILAIGRRDAVGLEPRGRHIFLDGGRLITLQAPLIEDDELVAEIGKLIGDDCAVQEEGFTEMDLFKLSLYNCGGQAGWRDLWHSAQGEMGQTRIRQVLKKWQYDPEKQQPVIEIDGERYILSQPPDPSSPRRMVKVNGTLPTTAEQVLALLPGVAGGVKEKSPVGKKTASRGQKLARGVRSDELETDPHDQWRLLLDHLDIDEEE